MRPISRSALLFRVLAAAGAAATGCESGTIDEKAVTQKAALHTEAMMHETGLAVGFTMAEDGALKKIMGSSGNAADSVVAPALSGGQPPTAMLKAMVGPMMARKMSVVQLPSMMTPEEQFDEVGHELRRVMEERLFVDANFESKTDGTATYLLHADPTCRPLPTDSDPPGTVPAIDPECAMDLEKVAVRIAVTADNGGTLMRVQIGPDRLELVTVGVRSDEVSLQVNLPKAKAATDYIGSQLGEEAPVQSFERLAGTLRFSLKKVAARTVTASLGITEALDVALVDGPAIATAATNPLFAVTSDGTGKTARLDVGLGATRVDSAWDPQNTGAKNRDLRVDTAGVYGHLQLDEAAEEITLTDVGIGQTKVAVRGTTIFDLNLNADTMRRFSGRVTATGEGVAQVEVTPKFDLSLAFDYNAVAADFATPPEAAIAHETYAVSLANGGAPAVLQEAPATATFAGGIKVVAGTLTLGVASAPAQTVTVTSGRCLISRDPAPEGSNPVFGKLVAADCN